MPPGLTLHYRPSAGSLGADIALEDIAEWVAAECPAMLHRLARARSREGLWGAA